MVVFDHAYHGRTNPSGADREVDAVQAPVRPVRARCRSYTGRRCRILLPAARAGVRSRVSGSAAAAPGDRRDRGADFRVANGNVRRRCRSTRHARAGSCARRPASSAAGAVARPARAAGAGAIPGRPRRRRPTGTPVASSTAMANASVRHGSRPRATSWSSRPRASAARPSASVVRARPVAAQARSAGTGRGAPRRTRSAAARLAVHVQRAELVSPVSACASKCTSDIRPSRPAGPRRARRDRVVPPSTTGIAPAAATATPPRPAPASERSMAGEHLGVAGVVARAGPAARRPRCAERRPRAVVLRGSRPGGSPTGRTGCRPVRGAAVDGAPDDDHVGCLGVRPASVEVARGQRRGT